MFHKLQISILTAAALWAAAGSSLHAETPQAVITGPTEARLGDLVVLDATESIGLGRMWLLAVAPEAKSFLPVDDGRRCVFASGTPGCYTFVLVVSGTTDGQPAAAMSRWTVEIVQPRPKPQPDPDPDPPGPQTIWATVILEEQDRDIDIARVLSDPSIHQWIAAGGHKWRTIDDDVTDRGGQTPAELKPYLGRAAAVGLPALIVTDAAGTVLHAGTLPGTAAELLDVLKAYGGD